MGGERGREIEDRVRKNYSQEILRDRETEVEIHKKEQGEKEERGGGRERKREGRREEERILSKKRMDNSETKAEAGEAEAERCRDGEDGLWEPPCQVKNRGGCLAVTAHSFPEGWRAPLLIPRCMASPSALDRGQTLVPKCGCRSLPSSALDQTPAEGPIPTAWVRGSLGVT